MAALKVAANQLLLSITLIIMCAQARGYKHIIFMHGILAGPSEFKPFAQFLNKTHPGTTYTVIDAYNYLESLRSMWTQVKNIRDKMEAVMKLHPEGVHLLCFSQGGLICRAVIESLDDHNVINFISLASPQGGQYGDTEYFDHLVPKFIKGEEYRFFYTSAGQDVSVGNYWNDPHHHSLYLKESVFLPVINNQSVNTRSQEYKSNFIRLQNLVLIGGPDDEVITPWQSSQFSAYDDKKQVIEMRDQPWYKLDSFGLKTLDQRKAIHLCTIPGVKHIHWRQNYTVYDKCIRPWLT